ncbi:MAG: hypothetical protein ABIT36_06605 [Steroidobacteraceae bacterium]
MAPTDLAGTPVAPGDKVLVIQAPIAAGTLDEDAREAFSNAIGHALIVQNVTPEGWLQLELVPPKFRTFDTILLDSTCTRRVSSTFGMVAHKHRWGPGRPRFTAPVRLFR